MNRTFKRTTAGCLAAVMAFSAFSCGKAEKKTDKKTDESKADEHVVNVVDEGEVVESLGGLDLSPVTMINPDIPADFSFESEAEAGTLVGDAAVLTGKFAGEFTGDGFVTFAQKDDEVTFEVDIPGEGSYDLKMVMGGDSETMTNLITVDGNPVVSFKNAQPQFTETVAEKIMIPAGKHTIGIKAQDGGIYIDSVKLVPSEPLDLSQYEVTKELSNPNASPKAKRLYNFLRDCYGKYTISGQYIDNLETGKEDREITEITKRTGETPVILGMDVGGLGISSQENGGGGATMLPYHAMDWYNNENGIVTLCWHWLAPSDYIGVNGQPWWRGFYTDSTNFSLSKALSGEDQKGHDALIAELDNMAEQLTILAENDIPILWRPLHEAGGDYRYPQNQWFWWGASGKDAYIELWKLMYDKFTNEYHLNNLIWVWNAQIPEWYPGDEYVDIIGYDCYPDPHDSSPQKEKYDLMKECSPTHSKIIAETEKGAMFDPDAAFSDGSRWAWFSTWNGEFTLKDLQLSDEYTTYEMWDKIYASDRVLTLSEMPDLKSYPMDTEAFLAANGGE